MEISEFVWTEDRITHIGRHGVEAEEFEAVCFGKAGVAGEGGRRESRRRRQADTSSASRSTSLTEKGILSLARDDRQREAALFCGGNHEDPPRSGQRAPTVGETAVQAGVKTDPVLRSMTPGATTTHALTSVTTTGCAATHQWGYRTTSGGAITNFPITGT